MTLLIECLLISNCDECQRKLSTFTFLVLSFLVTQVFLQFADEMQAWL